MQGQETIGRPMLGMPELAGSSTGHLTITYLLQTLEEGDDTVMDTTAVPMRQFVYIGRGMFAEVHKSTFE